MKNINDVVEIREFRIIDNNGCVIYIYGENLTDAIMNYEEGLTIEEIEDKIYERKTF